jgi:hypothetical protein
MIVINIVKLRHFAKRCRQRSKSLTNARPRRAPIDIGSLNALRSQAVDAPDLTSCIEALERLNSTLDMALAAAAHTLEKFSSTMTKAAEQAEKLDRFP